MITRLVKLNLKPDKAEEFELVFNQNKPLIDSFEGCQTTNLFKISGADSQYFTISYWESEEHLENYRASALFKSTWSRVKPLFAAKAQAFTLTSVIPL